MHRPKGEEEDYWNSSHFRAFTFEDDEDDLTKLKESRLAVNSIKLADDDDDEWDKVNWSGEPVGTESRSAVSTEFSPAQLSVGAPYAGDFFPDWLKSQGGFSVVFSFLNRYRLTSQVGGPMQVISVAMERFRSLQDKLLLLDYAVSGNDGNTITAVLIFMKRTLSKEVLFRELESRPTALRHFIHLLTETHEQRLLLDLLRSLLQYKEHLNISDENKRRDFLKSCISLPFSAEDAALVQDHFTLLERQIIIEAADSQAEKSGKSNVFQKFPRKASILNMPLITTLYYCVYYHYHESEGSYSSPSNLRQTFKVSEKQFFTSALSALSKLKSWSEVDSLFSSKSWLGFSRKKSPLSYGRVVDILHKNSAPSSVLVQYVALVEDPEQRLALAQKHKCHDIVINTFRDMKDRQMLVQYRDKVERGSDEERKITDLLNNSQIRWKN
uniref:Spermatogenesis-defective protein 39 homolog n=1 Tax=Neogobius melanostomus TaxID=47308 RepID=A0A8C6T2F1_9GOBI